MDSILKVGIDVGSTTIKLVVLDHEKKILYKNYARHFSEIGNALQENLTHLKEVVGERKFSFALTGSAGMGIAQRIGLPFVQEVIACAAAVKELIPQTDTVVELGGEDAKITYFGDAPEQRMNGVCAGGTGSFIDHMASLLSTDAPGLNALAEKGRQIYTIASRCGVFAKTDIQALMNDGAEKADIALSIFQAVVNQTIGNLAQGRPISGKVAFLGGPLHFLPELKKRFIETLKLDEDHVVDVDYGNYFVAMGSALSQEAKVIDACMLDACIQGAGQAAAAETRQADFTLFAAESEYEEFKARHDRDKVKRGELASYAGPVYVGIDAGSTTTKITVIGLDKEILYTSYGSNQGSPLQTVVGELKELYKALPEAAYIAGVLTTGYGEAIVKAAVHADGGEVETFAHLRAAQEFCPKVTFVLDIGGQDMKCFFVKDGNIGNITLNEACSAGCGSFIQNFAEGLHMTAAEFAAKAIESKAPVDLGTRCTVFMNSKVKQAQKEGAEVADISAGIAFSVIKNALFKVMQLKDTSTLGDHIVVQGGTFYNDAVLRCMEKLLDREVIRPDIAGLMGAYGAAILALEADERPEEKSQLLSSEQLAEFSVSTSSYRCQGCGNKCLVTMQKFPDGGKYFTGNRCERGAGGSKASHEVPNIYSYKYNRLFKAYAPKEGARRGRIGLPRVLNMYEDYPFWFTFFTELGYEVVLSGKSNAKMYYKGMSTIPSDSLCYPAKLVHGHIMDLVEKGIKKIFYPCEPYNMADELCQSDNHFNCPIVASYAENIRGNMDILKEQGIDFLQPFLPLDDEKRMVERLYEELGSHEGLSKKEIKAAVAAGYKELARYREDVRACGQTILEHIEKTGQHGIVLVGRPYHVDPEINHGITEMIQSYNLPILSEDAICHLPVKAQKLSIVNQWSYHARLYRAAQFVAEHPNLTLIQLSSFGCGLDALTTGQTKDILEAHDRIYTMIKLDEVSNLGAARIRLRSLMAALARKKPLPYREVKPIERPHFTADCKATHTILAPQMAPIHFELIKTALRKYGYNVVIPPMPDKHTTDVGLRYVNNDMCYPAIVVIGQLISALKDGLCDPEHTSIVLFQTCGACRATNYLGVLREALKYAGFPQVPVFACMGLPDETDDFKLTREMLVDVIKAAVYGDALMNVKNRMMPYELTAGSTKALYNKWLERAKDRIETESNDDELDQIAGKISNASKEDLRDCLVKLNVEKGINQLLNDIKKNFSILFKLTDQKLKEYGLSTLLNQGAQENNMRNNRQENIGDANYLQLNQNRRESLLNQNNEENNLNNVIQRAPNVVVEVEVVENLDEGKYGTRMSIIDFKTKYPDIWGRLDKEQRVYLQMILGYKQSLLLTIFCLFLSCVLFVPATTFTYCLGVFFIIYFLLKLTGERTRNRLTEMVQGKSREPSFWDRFFVWNKCIEDAIVMCCTKKKSGNSNNDNYEEMKDSILNVMLPERVSFFNTASSCKNTVLRMVNRVSSVLDHNVLS